MPSDFIDRAKLEAEADKHTSLLTGRDERIAHRAFLAGAAAYAVLLDAETTEEWGVRFPERGVTTKPLWTQDQAEDMTGEEFGEQTVSRRVLYGPWLPSEGGEKRG